jgi:hypothetical protein
MRFRDLEDGQKFYFAGKGEHCTKYGPGAYQIDGQPAMQHLTKRQRSYNVEPVGEPPAREPRRTEQEELLETLESVRFDLRHYPNLDRDDLLEKLVGVLEAVVRRGVS